MFSHGHFDHIFNMAIKCPEMNVLEWDNANIEITDWTINFTAMQRYITELTSHIPISINFPLITAGKCTSLQF